MTRTELIASLATEAGMEKREAKLFLESLTTLIEKNIKKGGEVPLKGLGKFKVQRRKARMGRNPATGEAIKIPAKTVVKFTVAKALKDLVLKKKR
jgi:DNA-binding protein HU-beta